MSVGPEVIAHRNLESGIKRILFVEPQSGYSTGFNDTVRVETLGPQYVAASVGEVAESRLLDLRTQQGQAEGLEGAMNSFDPQLIAIKGGYTTDMPVVKNLAKQAKKLNPDLPVVIGGHHISLSPQDLDIPEVDLIVYGEGEDIFPMVVQEMGGERRRDRIPYTYYRDEQGQWHKNLPVIQIDNNISRNDASMNERPTPQRELCDPYRDEYYFLYYPKPYSLETARGCRYRCSFCSVWQFHHGTYKAEGWERTFKEIERIPNGSYVNIVDDLAIQVMPQDRDAKKGKRVEDSDSWKLAKALIESGNTRRFWMQCRADNIVNNPDLYEKWAEAGLDMVLVGLESDDPAELKRVNKGSRVNVNEEAIDFLHSIDVKLWGAQIVFADATEDRFDKIKEYNLKHKIENPQFTIHTPLPGTVDWKTYQDQLITLGREYFDFLHPVLPTKLPIRKFVERYIDLYRHCHMGRDELRRLVSLGRITEEDAHLFTRKFVHLLRPQNFDDTVELHDNFWAGKLDRTPGTIALPDYIRADDHRLRLAA